MEFIILAGRNLWKHRARTIFVLLSISISGLVLIMLRGYLTYTYWGLGNGIIHGVDGGHFRIYKKGYLQYGDKDPKDYLLDKEEQERLRVALSSIEEVEVVSPRLGLSGLLTDGINSSFFFSTGADPALEGQIRFNTGESYIEGTGLDADRPYGVSIGKGFSENYEIHESQGITLYATTFEDYQNAIDVNVLGVFDAGMKEMNNMLIEMSLTASQKLMNTDSVTMLAVGLKSIDGGYLEWYDNDLRSYLKEVEPLLQKSGVDFEIETWMDHVPYYKSVKSLYDTTYMIIYAILILLIILSITNILLMSVMERTREIGIFRAMGFTRLQVGKIFVYESFWLAAIGSSIATLLGLVGSLAFNFSQFTWVPPGSSQEVPVMVFVGLSDYLNVSITLFLISTVSSLLAVYRSSGLSIIECLRVK